MKSVSGTMVVLRLMALAAPLYLRAQEEDTIPQE